MSTWNKSEVPCQFHRCSFKATSSVECQAQTCVQNVGVTRGCSLHHPKSTATSSLREDLKATASLRGHFYSVNQGLPLLIRLCCSTAVVLPDVDADSSCKVVLLIGPVSRATAERNLRLQSQRGSCLLHIALGFVHDVALGPLLRVYCAAVKHAVLPSFCRC